MKLKAFLTDPSWRPVQRQQDSKKGLQECKSCDQPWLTRISDTSQEALGCCMVFVLLFLLLLRQRHILSPSSSSRKSTVSWISNEASEILGDKQKLPKRQDLRWNLKVQNHKHIEGNKKDLSKTRRHIVRGLKVCDSLSLERQRHNL